MASTEMNSETLWVARFLEEKANVEAMVELWRSLDLPPEKLADSLRLAVLKVDARARRNGFEQAIDVGKVDWLELAERYAAMFG